MTDPFSVLGITSSASDEEIKKAYRQKCKQYHPDLNPNDPTAEEKFKQVQTAYNEIMQIKQGGPRAGAYGNSYGGQRGGQYQQQEYDNPFAGFGFGFDPFGFGYGSTYQQQASGPSETPEMQAANNYIRAGRYQEALNALSGIAEAQRTARWYYYAALANSGLGNSVNALQYARMAVQMEPSSYEYQNLLDQLQNRSRGYQTYSRQYSSAPDMGRWCMTMLALNCLCNCCCGGGGFYR